MPGIKGLTKGSRPDVEKRAEDFIAGAARSPAQDARQIEGPRFRRYTFSLTPQVSADIDKLSLVPREFRTNRSDVVKAGIEALKRLPEEELVALLREIA